VSLVLLFFSLDGGRKMFNYFCLPTDARELFGRFFQGFIISKNFPDGKRERQW
jgi:hypothetical protein